MKKILTCCFAILCLANLPVAAQEPYAGGFLKNYGIAVKASTLGVGADFITSLHPNIKVRLGLNYAGFLKYDINKNFEADAHPSGGPDVDVHVGETSLDFLTGNLLVDFFPLKSLGIHITAGLYIGKTNIPVNGSADHPFDVGGYIIIPGADHNLKATLKLGSIFKPYLGLGFGRTIPKSRVGFKFDIGLIYQGAPTIFSDNMDAAASVSNKFQKFLTDQDIPKILTDFWPMLSLSIIFRIK